MTTPLFEYTDTTRIADAAERQADALEGLLALLTARLPDLVAPSAPQAAAAPADAFNAMMGNPLQALGNLTAVAAPASDPVKPAPRVRVHWSKYDPRSRELARLRTAANHRAIAAKTPETRDAALVESAVYHNESQSRHGRLRRWMTEGKIVIDSDNLYRVAADGTKIKWVPSSTLTLPE